MRSGSGSVMVIVTVRSVHAKNGDGSHENGNDFQLVSRYINGVSYKL